MGHSKVLYALDEQGHYAPTPCSGWEAEEIVLDQAIAEFERSAADAWQRADRAMVRRSHITCTASAWILCCWPKAPVSSNGGYVGISDPARSKNCPADADSVMPRPWV